MKRIFTAIDISEMARALVSDYIEELRRDFPNIRVAWETAEKLHLTMKFLGDVEDDQLVNLLEAIEKTARRFSDFNLQIAGTGFFPSIRKARILWLGVPDKQGSLAKLKGILEGEFERIGFARETRNFNPHLTIARLREPHNSAGIVSLHATNEFSSPGFSASELVVYQSRLQPNGSQYTPIFRASFAK